MSAARNFASGEPVGVAPGLALDEPETPERASARQEYLLDSLVELNRRLWGTRDLHQAADGLLLSLMGQVGTARAALWLTENGSGQPVLIQCHGIVRSQARAVAVACWQELAEYFRRGQRSVAREDVHGGIGRSAQSLARLAQVELFAPLSAHEELFGLVALGPPAERPRYTSIELDVIEASLATGGLALRAAHLYSLAAESARHLRQVNGELLALDRLKSEFIDGVNHELRTPLTVVLGCLEGLATRGIAADERASLLDTATISARVLERLIERLLLFSESIQGDFEVHVAEADLGDLLARYHADRRPGISSGLRDFQLVGSPRRCLARLDERRVWQVLDELVDNAVKFSSPGTTIRIQLSDWTEDDRTWRRISVADEGVGIAPRHLPALFQSFRQVDGSLTRIANGLGIGLSSAKILVEAMGGRISAASVEGEGSTFSVLLPTA